MKNSIQNLDILSMIESAIRAPSGHNTQPWLFEIEDNKVEIHPDFNKRLPVVDPDNRELYISLGCATENFCISASHQGYDSNVTVCENNYIAIDLTLNNLIKADPLFKAIKARQSNRQIYSGKKITSDILDILKSIPSEKGIKFHFYENGTQQYTKISEYIIEGNAIQMNDYNFKNELKSWMRYNKKHQDKNNNGLSYAAFGAPNLPMFIVKPIISIMLNANSQNKGDKKKIETSSHFVLFTTQNNLTEEWINLGRVLERFLLKSTELGIANAHLNQPIEVKELTEKLKKSVNLENEYPTILLRLGYASEMPYSKRENIEQILIKSKNI